MHDYRSSIAQSGIVDIIVDSKFVDDDVLKKYVLAVSNLSDSSTGWGHSFFRSIDVFAPEVDESKTAFDWSWNNHYAKLQELQGCMEGAVLEMSTPSLSSTSWLEVILVEFVLRNRDRIDCVWPTLAQHYIRSAVAISAEDAISLDKSSPQQQQPLQSVQILPQRQGTVYGYSYVEER